MRDTLSSPIGFDFTPSAHPLSEKERLDAFENLGFGTVFTDHMVVIRWSPEQKWHDAKIVARQPFHMDPASSTLHYAQEIFEGMKAYRTPDEKTVLFRPRMNAKRFAESASRMAMPSVPEEIFVQSVEELVKVERDWIPAGDGSLYLRPFMFGSESFLGVRPAREYIFCVIASPVGSYFKGGVKPISVWVTEKYSRASPGGTGAAKCGGNYAASLIAQAEAVKNGCDQVVFLDSTEHRWVEELGGMNIFFVMENGILVTPPLTGTILPGITRDSILTLARETGLTVHERAYSFEEWKLDAASGKLREAFACGTAAVVAPIGSVRHANGEFTIGIDSNESITRALRRKLTSIQRSECVDPYGWVHAIRQK